MLVDVDRFPLRFGILLELTFQAMQLPFAVIPLVQFVSDRRKMGDLAISRRTAALAWLIAGVIVVLNVKLLYDTFVG